MLRQAEYIAALGLEHPAPAFVVLIYVALAWVALEMRDTRGTRWVGHDPEMMEQTQ